MILPRSGIFSRDEAEKREARNGACILMEGLFNTLGHDILGTNTIVPLFLAYYGAQLTFIGSLSTLQSILSAVAPLLLGGFVASSRSKRAFSLIANGVSRSSILLIPLFMVLGVRGPAMLAVFFIIMALFSPVQSLTGLTWNYLLGDCVSADRRGKLLGLLFAVSGVITFASSAIIKAIRASSLTEGSQYAAIFALGGMLMALSVSFYLPLHEKPHPVARESRNLKAYFAQLFNCYKNPLFRRALYTNAFSQLALAVNAFFFLFAKNALALNTNQISNLIVIQALGLMLGGLTTGRISEKFGLKRMLQCVESLGAIVPVMGLLALRGAHPFACACAAVFVMGFTRSGMIGYQAYILEIVPTEQTVYHIVARSLALLPLSLGSMAIGALITRFTNAPIFAAQIALCAGAVVCASRLKLTVYQRNAKVK